MRYSKFFLFMLLILLFITACSKQEAKVNIEQENELQINQNSVDSNDEPLEPSKDNDNIDDNTINEDIIVEIDEKEVVEDDFEIVANKLLEIDYSQYLDGNHKFSIEFPVEDSLGRLKITKKDSYSILENFIFDNELNIYLDKLDIINLKWNDYSILHTEEVMDKIIIYKDTQNYIVEMKNDKLDSFFGVIDYRGNWLVEPKYKEIIGLDKNNIGIGYKGRNWYVVTIDGRELKKIEKNYNNVPYVPLGIFARVEGVSYFLNEESKSLINKETLSKMQPGNYGIEQNGEYFVLQDYVNYPEIEAYILDKYLNLIDNRIIKPYDHVMLTAEGKIDKVYSNIEFETLKKEQVKFEHNGFIYKPLQFDLEIMDNKVIYDKRFWRKTESFYSYILVTDLADNILLDESTKYMTIDTSNITNQRFVSATVYPDDWTPAKSSEDVVFDLKELKTMSMKEFIGVIAEKINLNLDEFIMHNGEDGKLPYSFVPF